MAEKHPANIGKKEKSSYGIFIWNVLLDPEE